MATQSKSEEAVTEKKSTMTVKHIRGTRSRYEELGKRWVDPGEVLEVDTDKAIALLTLAREHRPCCGSSTTKIVRYFERA